MALGDQVGLQAVNALDAQFPGLEAFISRQLATLADNAHGLLDRLDGATATITLHIPPRSVGTVLTAVPDPPGPTPVVGGTFTPSKTT